MSQPAPAIPNAIAGPITDGILRRIRDAGLAVQHDQAVNEAEAALILMCVGPMAEELLRRRDAMKALANADTRLSNVTVFPGGANSAER